MESSLSIKKENLQELKDIVKNSRGVGEVLVVTNAGDGDIVKEALEHISKDTFRADGRVKILSHEETVRRGQWLGLLDAYKDWIEREKSFDKNSVSIGGMYPGKGTRMSPLTQRLHGIKPFFPMLIRESEEGDWLTGAAASLYTCNHAAFHLKRMGFRGMIWKWGDEPQIAATRLKDLDWNLSYVDFVRFGSAEVITESLARNKEWFKVDEKNDLIAQVRRRPRKNLLKRLDLEDTPEAAAMVHIGSPAFSYVFLEEATKIFGDWRGWVDVDGYLCDALTLDEKAWKEELLQNEDDSDLRELLEEHPEFYSACQELKENIRARRNGRPLKIKIIDYGRDLYWGDIGQLEKARQSIHVITQKDAEGEFARELAGLNDAKPDEFGNMVSGDCVYPKDGSVKNSVLIDARLYGRCMIDDSVVVQSDLANAEVMPGSVVYDSTASGLKMGKRAFSFKSIGESITIEEDSVHTNMPVDFHDIGKGLEDWKADSRQNVGSKENYKQVRFGNPRTFEEQQKIMRQRDIKPEKIEGEMDEKFRKPLLERIKSDG